MLEPVRFNIEIPGIRFIVLEHLQKYRGDLEDEIGRAIEHAITNFDMDAIVRSETHAAVREAVRAAIQRTISTLRWDEAFAAEVRAAILRDVNGGERAKGE